MQQLAEPLGVWTLFHASRWSLRYDVLLFIGRVAPCAFIGLYLRRCTSPGYGQPFCRYRPLRNYYPFFSDMSSAFSALLRMSSRRLNRSTRGFSGFEPYTRLRLCAALHALQPDCNKVSILVAMFQTVLRIFSGKVESFVCFSWNVGSLYQHHSANAKRRLSGAAPRKEIRSRSL